jgi:hypothetical protein
VAFPFGDPVRALYLAVMNPKVNEIAALEVPGIASPEMAQALKAG